MTKVRQHLRRFAFVRGANDNFAKRIALVVGCLLLALASKLAAGCSFCPPDVGTSLWKQLDDSHDAVLVELIQAPASDAKDPVSRYRISLVLKGASKQGDMIDVPLSVRSPVGSIHLLLDDGQSRNWMNPFGVSSQMRRFLRSASKLPTIDNRSRLEDRVQRLAFALPHLKSRDIQIARSVYGEFAAAPNEAVKQLKPILNHRELKAWIELEPVSNKHRRLMFTLLGVCHNPGDFEFVKAAMDDRLAREDLYELDAIIAIYIKLAGDRGLEDIERRLLRTDNVSIATQRAVANALKFHLDHESVIASERIIASCRLLLDDPQTADYVLRDLARWKDWESLGAVLKLQTQAGDKAWLSEPIAEYLRASQRAAHR